MTNWRVMGNALQGTFCAKDCLPSQQAALKLAKELRKKNRGTAFFVQEYEEARIGNNKLEAHR